ncbi:MAG: fumarate hydratase [Chitinivibrionales bacterium]|nr:fumarate hydratase [Chitinivibrionales bacterium]MBD3355631.1 fumarate hydratase [Chitinivibrionales bacterium]
MPMRAIAYNEVVTRVAELCKKAAYELPSDVHAALESAHGSENAPLGRSILRHCLDNAAIASRERMPICQDTGFAVYFVEMGAEVFIEGGLLADAVAEGTARGYTDGYLRKSIVADPLFDRKNTRDNTPPIVHLSIVPGDRLRLILAPKGGGSENMSAVAMLKPADGQQGVIDFIVETVVKAGGNPCPPTIVGVGIGGTFEMVTLLAKRALLRKVGEPNPDKRYAALEREILDRINASGVGPQGLGGTTTAFAVHINTYPCHIASLPVAVNLNCHAARHAEVVM